MPRLIDDLRNKAARLMLPRFIPPEKEQAWQDHAVKVMGTLMDPSLPVLCIDNVAEYLYAGTDQEDWDLGRDFPNLAPPFPMFWCEHRIVRKIHSKRCGDTDVSQWLPQGGRVGYFFVALERGSWAGEGIPDEAKWVLWTELFIDYSRPEGTADGPHGSTFMCIDAEGRLIGHPWMQSFARPEDSELMKTLMTWYHSPLLAISFLHCKNVTLVDNPVPAKLARRYRERHDGARLTDYKTLLIEPLKAILRNEGRAGEHGLAKAMHICRGHFRDYRQGAGLFGKYHQLVWTPALVRGTKGKSAPPREIEVKISGGSN